MSGRLLDELPAVFREDPFLGRYLLAFEKVLLGLAEGGSPSRGLEEKVATLATWFDPAKTPATFLPWLAQWVALSLRADLSETQQRDFLANTVLRYRLRGTSQNLVALLALFTKGTPTVVEDDAPYHFTVTISLPPPAAFDGKPEDYHVFIDRQTAIARALIELEKPAHTDYTLNPVFPSLQVGVYSTVGVDTLLGVALAEQASGQVAAPVSGAPAIPAGTTTPTTPAATTPAPAASPAATTSTTTATPAKGKTSPGDTPPIINRPMEEQ